MAGFLSSNNIKRKLSRILYHKKISIHIERILVSLIEVEKLLGIR